MSNNFRTKKGTNTGYRDSRGKPIHVGDIVKWRFDSCAYAGDYDGALKGEGVVTISTKVVSIDRIDDTYWCCSRGHIDDLAESSRFLTVAKKYNKQ